MSQPTTSTARTGQHPPRAGRWRGAALLGLTCLSAYSTAVGMQAQAVSYPLFGAVGTEQFLAYHAQYNDRIPFVVIAPGFVTFLGSIAFLWTRPREIPRAAGVLVATSGLVALLSTVLWAIPAHDRLDAIGFDQATLNSLLWANLVRTGALVAGTVTLLWSVGRMIRH